MHAPLQTRRPQLSPLPMVRVRRTCVSAPRGTAAATGASAGAALENTFTVPAVPPSSKLSVLSDFLLPELASLRLCAQRADAATRVAERRGAVRTAHLTSLGGQRRDYGRSHAPCAARAVTCRPLVPRLRAGCLRYPLGSQAIQGGQVLPLHGLGELRRDERRDIFALAVRPRCCPRRHHPASPPTPFRPRARRLCPHRRHRRRLSSGGSGRSRVGARA